METKRYINEKDMTWLASESISEEDEPDIEDYNDRFEGWRIAPYSLDTVLTDYPHIWIADGHKLAGYQYCSGGNSNGFVFVIPDYQELPPPPIEGLEFGWLESGEVSLSEKSILPEWASPDVGKFLKGDKTSLSYLEASHCLRALHEMGARWHGLYWSTHTLITSEKLATDVLSRHEKGRYEAADWKWPQGKPSEWRPCVLNECNGTVVVVFYTFSELGRETAYLHQDTYTKNYESQSKNTIVGTGADGIIF